MSSQNYATIQTRHSPLIYLFQKTVLAGSLIVTSVLVFVVFALRRQEWRGSSHFTQTVMDERTAVATTVQFTSHVLGLIQITAICTIIRLSYINSITSKSFSLPRLQFFLAASAQKMSWSLPWALSLLLVLFAAIAILPGILWSGALTPVFVDSNSSPTIHIPSFATNNFSTMWELSQLNPSSTTDPEGSWLTDKGLFAYDPSVLRGQLMNSASSSVDSGATYFHDKLDGTGYAYENRSYGAGSAVGIVPVPGLQTQSISYNETGFQSEVSCIHNSSTRWFLENITPSNSHFALWQAGGQNPDRIAQTGWIYFGYTFQDILGWAPSYNNITRSFYVTIISPATEAADEWGFRVYNNTQCHITFTPRNFNVFANVTGKVISVTPGDEVSWPSYGDTVMNKLREWLWDISYGDSCAGGCQLGRSLNLHVARLQNVTDDLTNSTLLRGVADYITAIVDDTLVSLAAARYISANHTTAVKADVAVASVVFGDMKFIYGIMAFQLLICAIYIFEAIRTRFWRDLPSLDFEDLGSLLIGALRGGMLVSEGSNEINDTVEETNPFSKNNVRLRLQDGTSQYPALVPEGDDIGKKHENESDEE
ncbi:hypothetical protein BT63DRAFT_297141 [Microthyrium microscopicum]|uniref:Uncharacterized protein n=1 Tax=Microthyrium microscopicum TaxID=703497 RepID=A0A6A6U7P0_9PEZI|nr:hypothetical protein BT63DRAFT_297141 [Microthyrium microscopicum]